MTNSAIARVLAVNSSSTHTFSKRNQLSIRLLVGLGVESDVHAGATVKHRSRVAKDPAQPNLRQVHLMQAELHEELCAQGFDVGSGDLGENITTQGINLLALPVGAQLHIGAKAVVEVTGLRTPCAQIDRFRKGMVVAVLDRDATGRLIRKTGVMSVVLAGGDIHAGDAIRVSLPAAPHRRLEPV